MAILQKNLKSMSTTCITNYMCIYMHHIHIHVPHAQMCTTCITNYRYIFMHHLHIHAPPNMHVCRCTIYTYMHHKHTCAPHASLNTHVHHQTPPKIKIYLVGLPSALYDQVKMISVLNQLFLLLLRCFS